MSTFEKLEVVIRYDDHPAKVPPLGAQPAADPNSCDIIDENGRPVFLDAESTRSDHVSVEFGPRDVAVLIARDGKAALVVVRVQVEEAVAAEPSAAVNGVY